MSKPAPAARPAPDPRGRKLASHIKWVRDCGAAAVASGVVVGLGVGLGGVTIRREVYIVLVASYGALLFVATFFWCRALAVLKRANPGSVASAVLPPLVVIGIALLNLSASSWPIKPHTQRWWEIVLFAFVVAVLGWWRRRAADELVAEIAEPSGKRRR